MVTGPISKPINQRIREGQESPPFRGRFGAITAGESVVKDFADDAKAGPYLPLNYLLLTNNSDEELTVILDAPDAEFTVLARDAVTIQSKNLFFRRIQVRNEDGATATGANEIEYVAQRQGADADTAVRGILSRVRGILG